MKLWKFFVSIDAKIVFAITVIKKLNFLVMVFQEIKTRHLQNLHSTITGFCIVKSQGVTTNTSEIPITFLKVIYIYILISISAPTHFQSESLSN